MDHTLNYGMGEGTLGSNLGIPKSEAKELMETYMSTYPAVQNMFDEFVTDTAKNGYAFTVMGRRRYLANITATESWLRKRAERQAVNLPIQGSAADVVKMAMIKCHYESGLEKDYGCRMLLQVHDELMFECPPENVTKATAIIREMMEHSLPGDLAVPLTVSIGVGGDWASTH